MHTSPQLLQFAAVLDEASLWHRMFGSNYREAVKVYCRIARAGKKALRRQMSAALSTVAEHAQKRTKFDNNVAYREMLGIHFQGVLSPWDDLHAILVWYEQTLVA